MAKNPKIEAFERTLQQVEKEYGKGAIMRLGDTGTRLEVSAVPTGSIALDVALGVGGFPRGRITEIYGAEASGKSTVALHAVARIQAEGGVAVYLDTENAFDPTYAQHIGVDPERLYISQPSTAEETLEMTDMLIRSGGTDLVVIDSVAALVPKAELEGEMGDSFVGLQARLMSQALRKLAGNIHKTNSIVIFINQLRQKIGVMFGNPETTTGGQALKFYATVRLDLRRKEALKQGEQIIGNRIIAKVVKNKVAPPFRTAEFDILFGKGIWKETDLLDTATQHNIVTRQGNWYVFGNTQIGQGRLGAAKFLEEHPDMAIKLEKEIRRRIFGDEGKKEK
ncbi:MAG: recombinase RecA [bacterium JZ-2024 1]